MQTLTGYPSIDKPWLKYYSKEAIESGVPRMTVYEYLRECNKGYENNICFEYFGKRIKYATFHSKVLETAKALLVLGVKEGERVSLCLPTMPETFYLFYAINYIGAIANMIDPRINEERIKMCIGKESNYVFMIDVYGEKIYRVISSLGIKNCVSISPVQSLSTVYKIGYRLKQGGYSSNKCLTWDASIKQYKQLYSVSKNEEYRKAIERLQNKIQECENPKR